MTTFRNPCYEPKGCYDPRPKPCPRPHCPIPPHQPHCDKGDDIKLVCGKGNDLVIPNFDFLFSLVLPQTIAHVAVDTSNFCSPTVKIEFSSNITATVALFDQLIVDFQLSRVCENQQEIPLQNYRYCLGTDFSLGGGNATGEPSVQQIGLGTINKCETFSFNYCECVTCPNCCEYLVKVISISDGFYVYGVTAQRVQNGSSSDPFVLMITNPNISAFAQS